MKKVLAVIGSNRKQVTFNAICEYENYLGSFGDIEFETIFLKDYNLGYCQGCKLCFDKGEAHCPLHDDRDDLIKKLEESDGVIFAVPNYAFHVPAQVKNLLDRLAFIFHRPRFFGKTFTSVVTQGFFGGKSIISYLNTMAENFGFKTTKGCVLRGLEPMTDAALDKNSKTIKKAALRFYRELKQPPKSPSYFRLILFRMARSGISNLDDSYYDYRHFKEMGWLESDYYCDSTLSPFKKLVGFLFDLLGRWLIKEA